MVGTLHYVHIMLDDNDGMAAAYQCIKGFQQFADVVEVQAGGSSSKMNSVGSAFSILR